LKLPVFLYLEVTVLLRIDKQVKGLASPELVGSAMLHVIIGILLIGISIVALRIYSILPGAEQKCSRRQEVDVSKNCSIAVFLGSGGHTSEALALVSALDFSRYTPRLYIISEGDSLSAEKAVALEARKTSSNKNEHAKREYTLLTIPRARRVHQPLTHDSAHCYNIFF
jgi:beta-1,4-N-acetylglucosaminyltransferase